MNSQELAEIIALSISAAISSKMSKHCGMFIKVIKRRKKLSKIRKMASNDEFEERRKLQILKSMVKVSLLKIVILAQYFVFVLSCLHFGSRMLQNK